MKLTLIPGNTSQGGHEHQFLSSCLLNDTIALDAGCLGFYDAPANQARVRHVFLSHSHIDHLASLPIFLENAYEARDECVTVHGSAAVLESCQRDLFNGRLWPDFIALSKKEPPFLTLSRFDPGQTLELEGLRITAVEVNHVVPTVGYLVADDHSTVAFVSDTGPTDAIWREANARPNLRAVFVEVTFPNSMAWLADVSLHLTPQTLARELAKVERSPRFIAIHIKARFREQIVAELHALNLPNLEIGRFGTPYVF